MTIKKWRPIWATLEKENRRLEESERRWEEENRRREQKLESRKLSAQLTLKRDGRWWCDECGAWHYDGEECPHDGADTVRYVKRELARATVPIAWGISYRQDVLRHIARNLNWWAESSESSAVIRDAYLRHPVLGPFLRGEIKERDFWDDDKRKKLNPKTVSWEWGGADYLLRDKSLKSENPDGWFDHHARPSPQIAKEPQKSRRTVPRGYVPDWVLQKLSHRQRIVYEMTVLAEPPAPIAEVAAELGIPDQSQISRIKRQAIERVTKLLARKTVK